MTNQSLMAASQLDRSPARILHHAQDLAAPPQTAFDLICEVEKWPVWLSFLRSARRTDPQQPLMLGSEVAIRSAIPGEEEELFEVDQFLEGHIVSLVGAYSIRRRIDLRIERKTARSKIIARLEYPTYGGVVGAIVDRLTIRRRLDAALADSLLHFKGLVEYDNRDRVLADF